MDAIYYRGGIIRPIVALVKSLALAIATDTATLIGRLFFSGQCRYRRWKTSM
jgi:hypothetical protein